MSSLMDNLIGGRRASGLGGWNRGRGRFGHRRGLMSRRGRARASPLARLALGGLAALGLSKMLGNRRQHGY